MPSRSSNRPSAIVYSVIGAEPLRTVRAINSPDSFFTAITSLVTQKSRQGVSIEIINIVTANFFNKRQEDFSNVCKSKQNLVKVIGSPK